MSQQQVTVDYIIECLKGSLIPETTKQCEERLKQCENIHGYGVLLAELAMNKTMVSQDIRQLSAILLKQYIENHWDTITEHSGYYLPSTEEKEKIKQLIAPGIADPSSKIRTAIAMCTGKIGVVDWPERWPTLITDLITCINSQTSDKNLMLGAMKCLEILCNPNELSDAQLQQIIIMVYPVFLNILKLNLFELSVQVKIINIFKNIVSFILSSYSKLLSDILKPVLPVWLEVFKVKLHSKVNANQDMDEQFTIQTGIIESISHLISNYPKKMAEYIPSLLPPIWSLFIDYYPIYEKKELLGEEDFDNIAHSSNSNEEGVTGINTLIASILEFMTTVIKKPTKALFEPYLDQIFKQSILYLQMTVELQELWESEPNQFLEQEDETNYHPRVNSGILIQKICDIYLSKGLQVLGQAISNMLVEANSQKQSHPQLWWRKREAALLALQTVAEPYIDQGDKRHFTFATLMSDVLSLDFKPLDPVADQAVTNDTRMILQGRALCVACKFSGEVSSDLSVPYLQQALTILASPTSPLPLKLASLKSIGEFFPNMDKSLVMQYVPSVLEYTAKMLNSVTEDCLLLVLDNVLAIGKVDVDTTCRLEPILTPCILNTWTNYGNDPMVCDTLKEIFQLFCKGKTVSVFPGILERVLPAFCIVIENYNNSLYVGLVEPTIDILGILMSTYKDNVDRVVVDRVFRPLTDILLDQSEDRGPDGPTIKAALCTIVPFIHRSSSHLQTYKHPKCGLSSIELLVKIADRYLCNSNEFTAMYTPPIIVAMILKLPTLIQPYLPSLLQTTLGVLRKCKLPSFKQSLLIIFARLFLLHRKEVIEYLVKVQITEEGNDNSNNGQPQNGYQFLMNQWLKYNEEIQTRLNINVSTLALLKILGEADQATMDIMVDGSMMVPSTMVGKTRAQTRQLTQSAVASAIKWTKVSLIQKITMVIIQTLQEEIDCKATAETRAIKQVQNAAGEEDEDDEEEYDEDEFNVDDAEFQELDTDEENEYYDEDEDAEEDFDPIAKEDPYYDIDIIKYIQEYLTNLQQSNAFVFSQIQPILVKNQTILK